MTRRSALWRRLGLTAPLVTAEVGDVVLDDRDLASVRIQRGGSSLSGHDPSTATLVTTRNLTTTGTTRRLDVRLDATRAAELAARTYTTSTAIRSRFRGRVGTQTSPDRGRRGRRGTTLAAAAWSSLLAHAPDTWTPTPGLTVAHAAQTLLRPSWEDRVRYVWDGANGAYWPTGDHDPIDAEGLLSILRDRMYLVHDLREGGWLRVRDLAAVEAAAEAAAAQTWPLARAHCLAPAEWSQNSSYPTQYRLTHRTPTGTAVVITGETPDGTTRVKDLDWTDMIAGDEQWRRVYGLRFDTFTWPWRLPSVTIRLDHLIASPYEGHRRAAGMLLGLDVSDAVPLADDWPPALAGVHLVTGIEEELTPDAWTMRLSLAPYGSLAGNPSPPVPPRTWAQAGTRTWADAGSRTWTQGVPA